jgi:hypothetical protein
MISPKTAKEPQPMIAAVPKNAMSNVATMPSTLPGSIPVEQRIRERAYELYESRGCEHGQDVQDWLRAEQEILKRGR